MINILSPKSLFARISLHIIFWIAVLGVYTFIYGRFNNDYISTFIHLIITLPIYLATTYVALYIVIPRYLEKKKFKTVIIFAVYIILGAAFLELLVTFGLMLTPSFKVFGYSNIRFNTSSLDVYFRLVGIMLVVILASSIKLLKNWYSAQKRSQELYREKVEAELNILKSQLHPHFLFNTLNNLYALTLRNSSKSSEVVLRLSEMLNYILYECNTDFVYIEKEIELIKNYIFLESIRYGNKLEINFNVSGEVTNRMIVPLILFPFVENSFKHKSSGKNEKPWINISLEIKNEIIHFSVKNSKYNSPRARPASSGIGIINVKKRLELIYKDDYKLEINDSQGIFEVRLELKSLTIAGSGYENQGNDS